MNLNVVRIQIAVAVIAFLLLRMAQSAGIGEWPGLRTDRRRLGRQGRLDRDGRRAAPGGGQMGQGRGPGTCRRRMLGDEIVKRGFTRGFTAGVLSFGSVLTPIIPPGIGMILYGTIGQVSIGQLFAAGFVPAFLLWCGLAGAISLTATRRGYRPERQTRPSLGEFGRALRGGIWALLFPVFLLLGLRMGVFTPSEIGAFAVIYAVVIGLVIHRELGRTSFLEALEEASPTSARSCS